MESSQNTADALDNLAAPLLPKLILEIVLEELVEKCTCKGVQRWGQVQDPTDTAAALNSRGTVFYLDTSHFLEHGFIPL